MVMRKKYAGSNRRIGQADRRTHQQAPLEKAPGKGWSVCPELYYKRTNPETGKITYSRNDRIGPIDRRKKKASFFISHHTKQKRNQSNQHCNFRVKLGFAKFLFLSKGKAVQEQKVCN